MTTTRTTRAATVTVLVAAALTWGAGAQPALAAPASATVGDVVCADGDGTVAVVLTAGEEETTFSIWLDDDLHGDDTVLAPGQSTTVALTGLDDGEHAVEVELAGDPDAGTDPVTVATAARTVACDPAPVGAYTNAKGSFPSDCDAAGVRVLASNTPIGGNTEDLQPVVFTLTFEKFVDQGAPGDGEDPGEGTDEPGEDPEDGVEEDEPRLGDQPVPSDPESPDGPETEAPVTLDTFTLDAGTPTYERRFDFAELGGFGRLTLAVGSTVVATTDYYGTCVYAADGGTGTATGGGYGLAGTGA